MTTAFLIVILLAAFAIMMGGFLGMAVGHAREHEKRRRAEQRILELEHEVEGLRRRALLRVYDAREEVA